MNDLIRIKKIILYKFRPKSVIINCIIIIKIIRFYDFILNKYVLSNL